jgi:uncharacterized protein (TIGR02271 family)
MDGTEYGRVTDPHGTRGVIEETPQARADGQVLVRFDEQLVLVPPDLLQMQADGSYRLKVALSELEHSFEYSDEYASERSERYVEGEHDVLPVVEEEVRVGKRQVETGTVRIHKHVHEHAEEVDIPLLADEVEVERVRVDRPVDGPVDIRHEGETTIIPLLKEVLVVQKQLVLHEEVHVRKRQREHHDVRQVTLRREEVSVERDADSRERKVDEAQRRERE